MAARAVAAAPASLLRGVRIGGSWQQAALLAPAIIILLAFLVAGVFADLLSAYDPEQIVLQERLIPPAFQAEGSWAHPLGTDNLGRDILSRVMYGARVSLLVVVTCIPASALIGTFCGLLAGWRLGWWDRFLMRIVDVQLALPAILFALLISVVFGASLLNVILIIIIFSWSGYARLVRADVLSLREQEFVVAARASGASDRRILFRHVLPNIVNTIVIMATLDVPSVILIEAALSFLNIGVAPGTPSWGAMISEGRNFMTIAWWPIWMPGIAILLVSLTGNLFGDWLRDTLDPRLRNVR